MRYMEDAPRRDVLNRLKTSRGHIDGIIRMVEDDTYCPEVMKQLSAVMAAMLVCAGSYSTVLVSRRRSVEDDTTPGSSSRVSSMRRLQLVQCMPVTTSVICSANVFFS